jgi:hypothetical protein
LRPLRRLILSVIPIVAAAAGVDLGEVGGGFLAEFRDHAFPDLATSRGTEPDAEVITLCDGIIRTENERSALLSLEPEDDARDRKA